MSITKCDNERCPSAAKCYRVTAPDHPYWQSWAHFETVSSGRCAHYLPAPTLLAPAPMAAFFNRPLGSMGGAP